MAGTCQWVQNCRPQLSVIKTASLRAHNGPRVCNWWRSNNRYDGEHSSVMKVWTHYNACLSSCHWFSSVREQMNLPATKRTLLTCRYTRERNVGVRTWIPWWRLQRGDSTVVWGSTEYRHPDGLMPDGIMLKMSMLQRTLVNLTHSCSSYRICPCWDTDSGTFVSSWSCLMPWREHWVTASFGTQFVSVLSCGVHLLHQPSFLRC